MEQKTYNIVRIFCAMAVAGVCSIAVTQGNYVLPIIVGATAAFALYAMKKRVNGVLADERDYQIAGTAARWALYIYAVAAAVGSMVLMAARQGRPGFEPAAQILAYSACALLIMQGLFFKYLRNRK
jgi:uncharacterized membrane protein